MIDDPLIDASIIDVPTMTIDACTTFSTQVDTCIIPTNGNMPLTLTGNNVYDTATHELRRGSTLIPTANATVTTSTGTIDVIYTSDFTLSANATLEGRGPLPLAIVASGNVQIDGTLDLVGPGSGSRTDVACGMSVGTKGENSNQGAGGGGGGAFQGDGGDGSDGNLDGQRHDGGPGGKKLAAPPTGLMGGCDGGDGGDANGDGPQAGDGGGAILIAAGTSITISANGVINAGGGGGNRGGGNGRGGSGGGSGGMILLESTSVTIAGVLAANGGGGGEGNTTGDNGDDGQPSATPASGGSGGDLSGGKGGNGSAGATLNGETTTDVQNGGGGGGGGGAGFIFIRNAAPSVSGTVSPAFLPWP